jgi:hypothetical protein
MPSLIIKRFLENWPIVRELLARENPELADKLEQVYHCIHANSATTRDKYEKMCGSIIPWSEFEAYVYSYVYVPASEKETKHYARTEQKTRVATESAIGEVIQRVASQVGKTAEWMSAFTAELVKLLTPLAMMVLKERGIDEKALADMSPEEAARKVAEALNTIWDFKQHQDKLIREIGELRARVEELETEVKFYSALIDAVVKYIPETIESIVKEVAQIASYKNPNAIALQLALAED